MLRMPSGLRRSVVRWVSQLSVSVGATLIATMIYGVLPKAVVPRLDPPPEMTSGGKFAARVASPAVLEAFDGLDTMPLPRLATAGSGSPAAFLVASAEPDTLPSAGSPVAGFTAMSPGRRSLRDGEPVGGGSAERPAKALKVARLVRVDAKHAKTATLQSATVEPVTPVSPDLPVGRADDGWLPKVMSTARGAWALTASAGDSLVAHVVPQIP